MPVGFAQSRLEVMESLEARPDLTVILDATAIPGRACRPDSSVTPATR